MQSLTGNLNVENFPETTVGGKKWKITRNVRNDVTFSTSRGCSDIQLPSHVLHVSPAHVLDFIFTLIGQVRANSPIYFHDGGVIDHQHLGGAGVLIVIREYSTSQDKTLLSCANVRLQQPTLTVSTAKLCFVSQSVSSLLIGFY